MSIDKEMQKAIEADGEKLRQLTGEDHGPSFDDYHDDYDDGDCWNCGGEGRVNDCIDGCCAEQDDIYCPDCSQRCPICKPSKPNHELQEVLREALEKTAEPGSQVTNGMRATTQQEK